MRRSAQKHILMTTARITLNPADAIAAINPNIYGHFAEHLGRCIYDGIGVGEDSRIPKSTRS